MDTMNPECLGIWLLALAVIVVCGALALATSPTHPLTGPDATDDTDDTPTADGEPADVADSVFYVYGPKHLPALGYVIVPHTPSQPSQPSQQHRQRLDSEARS